MKLICDWCKEDIYLVIISTIEHICLQVFKSNLKIWEFSFIGAFQIFYECLVRLITKLIASLVLQTCQFYMGNERELLVIKTNAKHQLRYVRCRVIDRLRKRLCQLATKPFCNLNKIIIHLCLFKLQLRKKSNLWHKPRIQEGNNTCCVK